MKRFRFDFNSGTKKDQCEGYINILPDTLFNESVGYGLEKCTSGCERKNENVLLKDFLLMADNKFKVMLPNGRYNIRVYAGDYEDNGDVGLRVKINGDNKHPMWINDRKVCEGVYETKVDEGIIEMEFTGKYVCINAIDIAPKVESIPRNLKAQTLLTKECSEVVLTWEGEACAYRIYRKDILNHTNTVTFCAYEPEFIDLTVELAGEYEYMVMAMDYFKFEGKPSEIAKVFLYDPSMPKSIPTGFKVMEATANSIALVWDSVEGAIDYNVYQKSKYGIYKKIAQVNTTQFTDHEVITDRAFIYAVDVRSLGGISEKAIVKTPIVADKLKRNMETLDRGLVAMKTCEGVFLSWRLNAYEYETNTDFNLYKNGVRLNSELITTSTNYLDKTGDAADEYTVKAVVNEVEEKEGYTTKVINAPYLSIKLDTPEPYTTPDGHTYNYSANDASVADLDADGEYEIILKWECNGKDNSHKGYTGLVYIDAYKLNGTKLWRINLGHNIRCGAHYTQFMVYDFDSDGYAEMIVKTADGTVDNAGNVVGDIHADYRNKDGFIIEGPEYLTLFNGRTGEILDTVDYDPPRGDISEWGDSWGNRVDRFLAAVAYLDGVNPSAVMCRGYYDHGCPTVLVAYDVVNKKLQKKWKFLANKYQNIEYTNQGYHNLGVGDIDGDGRDEIVYGACAIDHDATGIYSTGLEHGDAMHLGKFTPDTEGLDFYGIHEHASAEFGIETRNPATGEVLWGKFTGKDTGRGLTAKIDPRYRGNQFWAYQGAGLYNYDGTLISEKSPNSINFAIWWDGDLIRELSDHEWFGYETNKGIGKIYKWNYEKEELDIVLDTVDSYSNNGTKGNCCIQADIFGDWREEIVWRDKDSTELRIYTTTDITQHKFYTFMHDPVYRLGVAWQNTAYNQPPHTSFYIGDEMDPIPIPENNYIKKSGC
jgi:fibronectin type 3 domain-containing protein